MQPENKNDSVQLSTRYQQYDFAKRYSGGFSGRQVFPITGNGGKDIEQINNPKHSNDRIYGSGNQILINGIRRLTPTECERLMGLPDDWTKYWIDEYDDPVGRVHIISDTQRYKLCGNGVVVPVVKEIIKSLIK